ncbi:helix-turn-helix domain-containing protein [Nocardia sp. NPDC060256]|uniref:helix-turn-helix domain-containing protein n=1 Tax=unclassified Nocardia TaxID=2637762 RepID=UPI00366163A1
MDRTDTIWDTAAVRAAIGTGECGAIVRAVRRANNLTLADLAELCNYSVSTLSRLERGKQQLSDVRVLRSLADALGIPAQLLGLSDTITLPVHMGHQAAMVGVNPASDEETDPMRRRTLLTGLTSLAGAAALGAPELPMATALPLGQLEQVLLLPPADGIPIDLPRLAQELHTARAAFDLGRYTEVATRLPGLLTTTFATLEEANGDSIAASNVLLSQAYSLASRLMVKLSHDQLAWTTADRAVHTAYASDDILAQAAARRVWAIVLRRAGHSTTAHQLIINTATALQPHLARGVPYLTAYGFLLSTAAYTAAVDGDRHTAQSLIGEAIDTATRLDGTQGTSPTSFGPMSVDLYRISMARVLGDSGTAIEAAKRINPADIPKPESQARYWSDVARAFHQWGKPEDCYRALLAAEHAAPDEVRYRKPIQQITTSLLRNPAARAMPGLQAFAKRTGATSVPTSNH